MNISVRTTAKISETTNARQFHGRKTKRAVSEMVVVSEQTGGARNTRQQCTAFRWREISHFWMHILYSSQVIKHKHGQTKGVRTHGELLHSHGDRLVHFYRKHEWWPPLILITAWAGIENIRRARTEEQSNRQKMELFFYIYLIFRWWLKQNNINIYLISKFSLYCHCIQPFGAAYNAFIHYLSIFFSFSCQRCSLWIWLCVWVRALECLWRLGTTVLRLCTLLVAVAADAAGCVCVCLLQSHCIEQFCLVLSLFHHKLAFDWLIFLMCILAREA